MAVGGRERERESVYRYVSVCVWGGGKQRQGKELNGAVSADDRLRRYLMCAVCASVCVLQAVVTSDRGSALYRCIVDSGCLLVLLLLLLRSDIGGASDPVKKDTCHSLARLLKLIAASSLHDGDVTLATQLTRYVPVDVVRALADSDSSAAAWTTLREEVEYPSGWWNARYVF